uniref:Putative secreted protein n=1 Tax=Anopheles marajoara TaxID=58244 RepID=A0A2M4CAI5_9DIPT
MAVHRRHRLGCVFTLCCQLCCCAVAQSSRGIDYSLPFLCPTFATQQQPKPSPSTVSEINCASNACGECFKFQNILIALQRVANCV